MNAVDFLYAAGAFPVGSALVAVLKPLGAMLKKSEPSLKGVPKDAILYSFHPEVYLLMLNGSLKTQDEPPSTMLGYRCLASYAFEPWCRMHGVPVFRYVRQSNPDPMSQIVQFLKANSSTRLIIATDSGGPYGRVRASLIELQKQTGRPLVALRHFSTRSVKAGGHLIPLPFSSLQARLSEPLFKREDESEAVYLERLQKAAESLGK